MVLVKIVEGITLIDIFWRTFHMKYRVLLHLGFPHGPLETLKLSLNHAIFLITLALSLIY